MKTFPDGDERYLTRPAGNDGSRECSTEIVSDSGTMQARTFATSELKYVEFKTPSDVAELDSTRSWDPIEDNDWSSESMPPSTANRSRLGLPALANTTRRRVRKAGTGLGGAGVFDW